MNCKICKNHNIKCIIKKWWFWLIIIVVVIVGVIFIKEYREQKKLNDTMETIGESALVFYEEAQNAEGYSDYFIYNYETGEVEYHPPITLEKYNSIKDGMTEKQVISILGNGEKMQPEGSVGFLMTWGELETWKSPYYRIQIKFDSSGKVNSKSQIGLE